MGSILNSTRAPRQAIVLIAVWIVLSGAGLGALAYYGGQAGTRGALPSQWPETAEVLRTPGEKTLVLFGHPKCPCTRASLTELQRIWGQGRHAVRGKIVFIQPEGVGPDWCDERLVEAAARIPEMEIIWDESGRLATALGVETSGHVILCGTDGSIRFSGGVTASRGHEGRSDGHRALQRLLTDDEAPSVHTPVFGCPLFADSDPRSTLEDSRP